MKDGEIRLHRQAIQVGCQALQAGICPALTGRCIRNECAAHMNCCMTGATVLVADDEPDILDINTHVLENMGLQVIECRCGQEAFDVILDEQTHFDVAVLDITMPHRDGIEVCRALRSVEPDLPVIFATGYCDYRIENTLNEFDSCALIVKPFTLETLRKTIGALLCPEIAHRRQLSTLAPNTTPDTAGSISSLA